jgi:fructose-specific component phosphotransferase system IIB-like protein
MPKELACERAVANPLAGQEDPLAVVPGSVEENEQDDVQRRCFVGDAKDCPSMQGPEIQLTVEAEQIPASTAGWHPY